MGMLVHSRPAIKRTGENGDSVLLAPNRTPACLLRPRGQIEHILYTGNERYYTGTQCTTRVLVLYTGTRDHRLSAELALAAAVVAAHELHGEALAREKRPRARAPGGAISTGCDLTDAALATALAATSEPPLT